MRLAVTFPRKKMAMQRRLDREEDHDDALRPAGIEKLMPGPTW